jgi:hypothetical protein
MLTRSLLIALAFLFPTMIYAQPAADYALQLEAKTQQSPPQIMLSWKKVAGAASYVVQRKSKFGISWSNLATLTAIDSTYIDVNVVADSAYEYMVQGQGGTNPTGYIYAGIREKAIHSRGSLVLLVDSLFTDSCKTEIARLMDDLSGDGWKVIRHDVSRTASVPQVKALIVNDYQASGNVNALLLLGHIAVPYSGELYPDGHTNHNGAWPADIYYGDMNGVWTDVSVNNTTASRPENKNIPGDGKFDQTSIPSDIELQVGRIDFANMPAFAKTEIELMRNYLNKDHMYKMDSIPVVKRGLVDDNFGGFGGEAFAANAWRNFSPLLGRDSTRTGDLLDTLNYYNYQWSYGCGGGGYTAAGGIGTTADFAVNHVNGIFMMLFGSYFGDWDSQNNFLRAPLCARTPALVDVWAGRPNWFFHHMALGENIGFAARLSQNDVLYTPTGYGVRYVHPALMGDLSLRTDYIKPVTNVSATPVVNHGATITWTASPATAIAGYYVYRSDSLYGNYSLISPLLSSTNFSDTTGVNGKKYYMVRPVKLQSTPSGNYYNLGIGQIDSATVTFPNAITSLATQELTIDVFPNPSKSNLNLTIGTLHSGTSTITVLDVYGRRVLHTTKNLHGGSNAIPLDIRSLTAGTYLAQVQTEKGGCTKKFTKMD